MSHHYGYPTCLSQWYQMAEKNPTENTVFISLLFGFWQPRYDIPNFCQGNGTESKHGSSYIEQLLDLLLLSNGYATVDGDTWENNKWEFCLLNTGLKIHIEGKIIPSYVFITFLFSFLKFSYEMIKLLLASLLEKYLESR